MEEIGCKDESFSKSIFEKMGRIIYSDTDVIVIDGYAETVDGNSRDVPITEESVKEFAESYFSEGMEEAHVPGAVILVVKDHDILYKQGFGNANLENDTKVDTEESLFRIGSITKLFTATAIMQLVEEGLIDVEGDVNDYLTYFQIDTGSLIVK